jgi:hypothetical protein
MPLVLRADHRSRAFKPALRHQLHARHRRVHRIPHPTSVTIAIRPSYSGRDGENKPHISEKQKRFIFAARAGQEFAMTSDLPVEAEQESDF